MNTITISDGRLVVEPAGLDAVWSFHRRIEVPLEHVDGITADPGVTAEPKGIRAPGLAVPGKWAGTFIHHGEHSFWNVGPSGIPVVIRLHDEAWVQLVLSVENPSVVVRLVEAAVTGSRSAGDR